VFSLSSDEKKEGLSNRHIELKTLYKGKGDTKIKGDVDIKVKHPNFGFKKPYIHMPHHSSTGYEIIKDDK